VRGTRGATTARRTWTAARFASTPADYTDEAAKARYSELYVKAYDVAVLEEDWTPEDVDNFPVGSRIRYLVEGAA
jgi:hypothetical protein